VAFNINSGWDVAHHHIHEAFIHLGEAYAHNRYATEKWGDFDSNFHWADLLSASGEVRQHITAESKLCIKAVVLFQAGMEAWISWAYSENALKGLGKPRSFIPKWETAFKHLNHSYDFSDYSYFYKKIRNPVVHPSSQKDVESVSKIWFKPVYQGMLSGWEAMAALSHNLGRTFENDSWEVMCRVNNAPKVIIEQEVTDLQLLEQGMSQKHLLGFRGELATE
jgi:hypothetical protein